MEYTTEIADSINENLHLENAGNYTRDQVCCALSEAIASSQERIKQCIVNRYGVDNEGLFHRNPDFRKLIKKVIMPIAYGAGINNKGILNRILEEFIERGSQDSFRILRDVAQESHSFENFVALLEDQQYNDLRGMIEENLGTHWNTNIELKKFVEDKRLYSSLSDFIDVLGNLSARTQKTDAMVFIELVEWKLRQSIGDFRKLFSDLSNLIFKLESGISLITPDGLEVRTGGVKKKKSVRISEFIDTPCYTNAITAKNDGVAQIIHLSSHGFCFDYQVMSAKKRSTFLGVNYIHALDAYHLRQVLVAAENENFQGGLQAIHDNLGTHAGEMQTLHSMVLREFEKIYHRSPLNQLLDYYKERLEWAKASFVFRGDGDRDQAEQIADQVGKKISEIENRYQLNSEWFGETDIKISPYLFS